MRAINVLLAIAVSLLLALLVFEGGLRLVGFAPQATLNQFDAALGWSKIPGAEVERSTREFDVTFEINERGLRDDAGLAPEKPAGVYRVVVLGDSFVLGYTVDRQDLFVDQLEGWWNAERRRVEVVNGGTEGWSTDQEVAWFLDVGAAYEPDLVVICPFENDIYWCGEREYTRFPKPRFEPDGTREPGPLADPGPQPFLRRTAIGNFLGTVVYPMVAKPNPAIFYEVPGTDVALYREFTPLMVERPVFLEEPIQRCRGALIALAERCDQLGARLVMAPIPSESAIQPAERARFRESGMGGLPDDRWSPDLPVDLYLELARDVGIESLDARSTLRAHAAGGAELYFRDEWHFTPEGNRAFATFLHDELDTLRVFPAEHAALGAASLPESAIEAGAPRWLFVFGALWLALSIGYAVTYRDEPAWKAPVGVFALLALVFTIVLGGGALLERMPPSVGTWVLVLAILVLFVFIAWKLGRRLATIVELFRAFTLRGHWYLMPLVVVLLTIGSLLVVAASSPLIAPFIYTLF